MSELTADGRRRVIPTRHLDSRDVRSETQRLCRGVEG
jgi:hypothetical protein